MHPVLTVFVICVIASRGVRAAPWENIAELSDNEDRSDLHAVSAQDDDAVPEVIDQPLKQERFWFIKFPSFFSDDPPPPSSPPPPPPVIIINPAPPCPCPGSGTTTTTTSPARTTPLSTKESTFAPVSTLRTTRQPNRKPRPSRTPAPATLKTTTKNPNDPGLSVSLGLMGASVHFRPHNMHMLPNTTTTESTSTTVKPSTTTSTTTTTTTTETPTTSTTTTTTQRTIPSTTRTKVPVGTSTSRYQPSASFTILLQPTMHGAGVTPSKDGNGLNVNSEESKYDYDTIWGTGDDGEHDRGSDSVRRNYKVPIKTFEERLMMDK